MTDETYTRQDNADLPCYHPISIQMLDNALIAWSEAFFDRAVLPCKEWMDPTAYDRVVVDAMGEKVQVRG